MPRASRHLALILAGALAYAPQSYAADSAAKIAVHASLSGPSEFAGHALLDAVRFAVDEANAAGASPAFELAVYDDRSTEEGSREAARQMASGDALVVIGPSTSAWARRLSGLCREGRPGHRRHHTRR
jgi:ABC-type branched-subunit amino acid transport system substrate-binding protein